MWNVIQYFEEQYAKGDLLMENRNFQLDTEWNIIHYPEKPTGFGVLLIGDERHFVDESKSFWLQNEGKYNMIKKLKEAGYTIFSSNLYGRNWGSEKAVNLAQRLYQHVIRNEIINGKIHILAEGMGALIAIKLMELMKSNLRSMVFINPILSLSQHVHLEKENKFFYKKLTKELEAAFQIDHHQLESEIFTKEPQLSTDSEIPIKIIHVMSLGRSLQQYKLKGNSLDISYILPEKNDQTSQIMIKFFRLYERYL